MPRLTLPSFTPHPGQATLLRSARKRNVACMGRRFGKTYLLQDVILNQPGGALGGCDGRGRVGLPCAWYAPNDSYFTRVYRDIALQYAKIIRKVIARRKRDRADLAEEAAILEVYEAALEGAE